MRQARDASPGFCPTASGNDRGTSSQTCLVIVTTNYTIHGWLGIVHCAFTVLQTGEVSSLATTFALPLVAKTEHAAARPVKYTALKLREHFSPMTVATERPTMVMPIRFVKGGFRGKSWHLHFHSIPFVRFLEFNLTISLFAYFTLRRRAMIPGICKHRPTPGTSAEDTLAEDCRTRPTVFPNDSLVAWGRIRRNLIAASAKRIWTTDSQKLSLSNPELSRIMMRVR